MPVGRLPLLWQCTWLLLSSLCVPQGESLAAQSFVASRRDADAADTNAGSASLVALKEEAEAADASEWPGRSSAGRGPPTSLAARAHVSGTGLTRRESLKSLMKQRSRLKAAKEIQRAEMAQRAIDLAAAKKRVEHLAAATNCTLPAEIPRAQWCLQSVGQRGPNSKDFLVATYGSGSNDSVSRRLCDLQYRYFEYLDLEELGLPSHLEAENGGRPTLLDIGGNIGTFSAMFAKRGYNVYTVEALTTNRALMHSTLCANPDLRESVTLLQALVSTPADVSTECKVCLDFGGDATIECPGDRDPKSPDCQSRPADVGKGKRVVETLSATTIDNLLKEHPALAERGGVDVVKIDVEGYEWRVLEGAERFLREVQPRYIVLEIQMNPPKGALIGATPEQVFQKLRGLGYDAYAERFGKRKLHAYPYEDIKLYGSPNFFFRRKDLAPTPPPRRKHSAKDEPRVSHTLPHHRLASTPPHARR